MITMAFKIQSNTGEEHLSKAGKVEPFWITLMYAKSPYVMGRDAKADTLFCEI